MTNKQLGSYLSWVCNQLREGIKEADIQLEGVERHQIVSFTGDVTEVFSSVFYPSGSYSDNYKLVDGPVVALDKLSVLLEELEKQSTQLSKGD